VNSFLQALRAVSSTGVPYQDVLKHWERTYSDPELEGLTHSPTLTDLAGYETWELIEVPLSKIVLHHDWVEDDKVKHYVQKHQDGQKFPAVILVPQGDKFVTLDGVHRISAAQKVGLKKISAYVPVQSIQEATSVVIDDSVEHSLQSNEQKSLEEAAKVFADKPDGIWDDGKEWLVKKENGSIAGLINFMEYQTDSDLEYIPYDDVSRIDFIIIAPDSRRKGIGKELLLHAIRTHKAVESNMTATRAGDALWKSIQGTPGIEVRYNPKSREYGHVAWVTAGRSVASTVGGFKVDWSQGVVKYDGDPVVNFHTPGAQRYMTKTDGEDNALVPTNTLIIDFVWVPKAMRGKNVAHDALQLLRKEASGRGFKGVLAQPVSLGGWRALRKVFGEPSGVWGILGESSKEDLERFLPAVSPYDEVPESVAEFEVEWAI
jgi:GNAT superfamily N-acetyltransferase